MSLIVVGLARIRRSVAASFLVLAVGCASSDDQGNLPAPGENAPVSDSATTCIAASEDRLPYSYCVPATWRVFDLIDDGQIDIDMVDGAGQIIGVAGASSPVQPNGRLNRFVPFPEGFRNAQDRRRFLGEVGFEPHAVRDLTTETLTIDGRTGSILRLTIDIGEPEITRVIAARVPVGSGAGIRLKFFWDPSKADDEVIMQVISSVRIDEPMMEALLKGTPAPSESSL